jgi:anti-sigma B factor antagonist
VNPLKTDSELVPAARKDGTTVIASLYGEIDLHNSPELRHVILALMQAHAPQRLVLNLMQVPYMDSSAVAVLVEALQKMRKSGGKIFLTNLQPRVQGLLEIARLSSVFTIVLDELEALKP